MLEYGNIIWGPQYILDQEQIEKIQRRATKMIHDLENYTYNEALNLPSLKYRRLRADMILIYQLFHKFFSINTSDLITAATFQPLEVIITNYSVDSRVRSNFSTCPHPPDS